MYAATLGLQRSREHRPRTITHDLVEQPPARRALFVGRVRTWTALSVGVPSRTSAPTPALDQNYWDFQIIVGKVRPLTSPDRGPSTSSDHCSAGNRSRVQSRHMDSRSYQIDLPTGMSIPEAEAAALAYLGRETVIDFRCTGHRASDSPGLRTYSFTYQTR